MKRVLVTRGEPGAGETAARLLARGLQPVVEPLFALEPVAADLPPFDALAFTSANGVRALAHLSPRRDVPVFCVGARTAEAAREAGFAAVASADGDVAALAALIARKLAPGARLLHAGNEESRGDLAGRLAAVSVAAEFRALFRAAPIATPGPALGAWLAGQPAFEATLIHSPRAASILAGFLAASPAHGELRAAAISEAAAAPLRPFAWAVELAASPEEAALFDALDRLLTQA